MTKARLQVWSCQCFHHFKEQRKTTQYLLEVHWWWRLHVYIFYSLVLVHVWWVLSSALHSALGAGDFPLHLPFGNAPHFPNGLCSRPRWCTNIAMAAQEKEILTCGVRGSPGKCSLPPSRRHMHVAPTTSPWQSNRKSISISTLLKYCADAGQLATSPCSRMLTLDPKGMPTSICFLLTPMLLLAREKDISITVLKQDLPRQNKKIKARRVTRVSEYSRINVPWKMRFKHCKTQSCSYE